jgi:O-antigen/teichoic acid export membrane protein
MTAGRNAIANYLGQGWASLMGIAFVPLYIRTMGAETYGLVGIFAVLQAWMALLDLGLTPTLTREMARLRAGTHTADSIRDLLRTLEFAYVLLALLMIVAIAICSHWLADGWLRAEKLAPEEVALAIRIMSFVLAARWLEQVYRGALQGLQDQIWLNGIQAFLATLRWGGAYVVIAYGQPTITAFFIWQGVVSVLTTILLVRRTYRQLPRPGRRAAFRLGALYEIRTFASGMFLGAVLGVVLTQSDKLIISKLLPLDQLGYYMLASTLSGGLLQLITPMNTALYPVLTEQATRGSTDALVATYLRGCQWMAAIVTPPALLLSFFATPVLTAWTGDTALAHAAAPLLTPLALGTLLNGLMNLPYMLQLAHGWTGLSVRINLVAVALVLPAIAWIIPRHGAAGAAWMWFALNAGYVLVTAQLMHRRIVPAVKWPWYRAAILMPLLAGVLTAAVLRHVMPDPDSRTTATSLVIEAGLAIALAVIAVLPDVRRRMTSSLSGLLTSGLR